MLNKKSGNNLTIASGGGGQTQAQRINIRKDLEDLYSENYKILKLQPSKAPSRNM
jgi:hypothetical protein